MSDLLTWARAQRKLTEFLATQAAKDMTDEEIVEVAIAFPFYVQEKTHPAGELCRDPETEEVYRCLVEYDGSVDTEVTIQDETHWQKL